MINIITQYHYLHYYCPRSYKQFEITNKIFLDCYTVVSNRGLSLPVMLPRNINGCALPISPLDLCIIIYIVKVCRRSHFMYLLEHNYTIHGSICCYHSFSLTARQKGPHKLQQSA